MAISERRMKTAIKKYNDLMYRLCLDHLTIGTRDSEFPEEKAKWNLRDMVSECQYHQMQESINKGDTKSPFMVR